MKKGFAVLVAVMAVVAAATIITQLPSNSLQGNIVRQGTPIIASSAPACGDSAPQCNGSCLIETDVCATEVDRAGNVIACGCVPGSAKTLKGDSIKK